MIEVVLAVGVPAFTGVVIEMIRRNGSQTRADIQALRKENDQQHNESKKHIEKLTETAADTNVRVAVMETELKHVSKQVDKNAAYIEYRRNQGSS